MTRHHPELQHLAVSALAVVVIHFGSACASMKLAPKLTREQREILRSQHLDLVVGVEEYKWPSYSDGLTSALQNCGIFRKVDHLERLPSCDIIARVEEQIHGEPVIPLLPCVTLGIVPLVVNEQHGESFSLAPASGKGKNVRIRCVYRTPTVLGWAAAVLNPLPQWTSADFESTDRFLDQLSLAIARNADSIRAMVKAGGTDNENRTSP
jgi:hypothetical protein